MITSILVFLLVLSILVLVHELGHFFVARKLGVLVEEFGFGLPPRIFGKKIGETIYSINLLPFGGFVRLHGETTEDGVVYPRRAFLNKSKKKRALIIIAGVVMNFILGVVAFAIVYSFLGIPKETNLVKIVEIAPGSPAQTAGIIVGDIVKSVDKNEVTTVDEFVSLIEEKKGKRTVLEIESGTESKNVTITPRESPPPEEGPLGVVITTTDIYFPPYWQRPFVGVYYGFNEAVIWGGRILGGFVKIFKDLFVGVAPKDVAGPVGIFAITTQAAKGGVLELISFIGILSVNLAILNIIPFPALDGGRLLFIGIETFIGRKVLPKIEAVVHTIGMVILLLALLAITAHDIQGLIRAGSLSNFVEGVLK
jgi:regulator of sigma E protease